MVDADPRMYNIKVDATYANMLTNAVDSGETTITFTSVAPGGSLIRAPDNNPALVQVANDTSAVWFFDNNGGTNNEITATSSLASDGQKGVIGGDFMIAQFVTLGRYYTDTAGNVYGMISSTPAFDNGGSGDKNANTLGMIVTTQNGANSIFFNGAGWTSNAANPKATYYVGDSPSQPLAGTVNPAKVDIGSKDGTTPEKMTSYLMYRPNGGVWVGIAQLAWSWGGETTVANNVQTVASNTSGSATPTSPLTTANAFPEWSNTSANITRGGWQKQ